MKLINIAGLFAEITGSGRICLVFSFLVLVLIGLWLLAKPLAKDWRYTMGFLTATGIATSHRALPYDATYLLPRLLSSPDLCEWDVFFALGIGCAAFAGSGVGPLLVFGLLMVAVYGRQTSLMA